MGRCTSTSDGDDGGRERGSGCVPEHRAEVTHTNSREAMASRISIYISTRHRCPIPLLCALLIDIIHHRSVLVVLIVTLTVMLPP